MFEGILYGTDGQPLPGTPIEYYNWDCPNELSTTTTTDASGFYQFSVDFSSCVGFGEGGIYFNLGYLTVNYTHDNRLWGHEIFLDSYSEFQSSICTVQADLTTLCQNDIRLPTLWGPLSGNIYHPSTGDYSLMDITSYNYQYGYETFDYLYDNIASGSQTYGPVLVPLREGVLQVSGSGNWFTAYTMPSLDGLIQDIGEATAPVTVTVLDDLGQPLVGVAVSLNSYASGYTSLNGTSDSNGEFSAIMPVGQIYAYSSSPYYYGGGFAAVKDQPVLIDLNGAANCIVSGTAFDQTATPLPADSPVLLYNSGTYLSALTDPSGQFNIPGVRPGDTFFTDDNLFWWGQFHVIDNCRTGDGSPRVIRMDRGYIEPFIEPPFLGEF